MKPPEERSVSHSISCTPLQWEQMRELAQEAGRQMSPYIVGRVLKRDGFGDEETGRGHALVLDEGQQREMHDSALAAEAAISQLFGLSDTSSPGLHEIVAMLFEARLDEMARTGRQDEMESLLSPIIGLERATDIIRRVREPPRQGR